MKSLIDWALNRLSENSTWRGIVLLITSAGVTIEPTKAAAIISAGLAIVGLINVLRKSPTSPDATPPTTPPTP